jgi:hypothetical protein
MSATDGGDWSVPTQLKVRWVHEPPGRGGELINPLLTVVKSATALFTGGASIANNNSIIFLLVSMLTQQPKCQLQSEHE